MISATFIQKVLSFSRRRLLLPLSIVRVSALVALTGAALFGQSGTIVGLVTDASHAIVPGAALHVTAPGTSTTRDVKTNAEGRFEILDLAPGTYSIKITANGFKAYDVSEIQLSGAEVRDLGTISLEVGAVTESVE